MRTNRSIVGCIAGLAAVAAVACGLQPCNVTDDILDCSFRKKTVLVDSEIPQDRTEWKLWNLRGNNIRTFPLGRYSVDRIDMAENEIGLGDLEPIEYIVSISSLDVSSNYLTSLKFLLQCTPYNLSVSDNEIADLNDIQRCQYLQRLQMANNRLTNLSDNAFTAAADTLKYLDISGNPIQEVSSTAFGNMPQLNTLYLSETRQLSTLPGNVFDGLAALQFLYLSGNAFADLHVDVFKSLVNLRILHLQRNALRTLPAGLFRNVVQLQSLVLDNNQLEELPEELFSRLHSLEDLSIRSNRLFSVPQLSEVLGPLRTALFNDNLITKVDEAALRALFRHGFQFGDLRGNPMKNDSLQWASTSGDMRVAWDSSPDRLPCADVSLLVEGHGSVALCVCNVHMSVTRP